MNNQRLFASFLLIILLFLMAACQTTTAMLPTHTKTVQPPTKTGTATPLPSRTPAPTLTHTPAISSTPTETLTPTSRWDDAHLSLTPLPPSIDAINPDNIEDIQKIAVWGTGRANQVKISPDGRILVVGTNIGAFLYDSLTYELLDILKTPFTVQSIAFSSDNRLLALGQTHFTIDLFERQTLELLHRFSSLDRTSSPTASTAVTFSADNTHLNLVTLKPEIIDIDSWDVKSFQPAGQFSVENDKAAFINAEINLVGILHENTLDLQSLTAFEERQSVPFAEIDQDSFWEAFSQNEGKIVPSSDGTFLLMHNGSSVIHWEILADEITYRLDDYVLDLPDPCDEAPQTCRNSEGGFSWACEEDLNTPPIATIGLSPENYMVLISLNEGRSEFRRAEDGFLDWEIDVSFTDLAFAPSGEYFLGIQPDGTIEKRATLDGSLISILDQHPDQLYDLDFSPDNSVLAAGFSDGWIRVYSAVDGQFLGVLEGTATSLQFSPDGLLLAAGLIDGTLRVFDLAGGRYDDLQPGHLDAVTDIEFSSDGQQILSGSDDCTAGLWDVALRYRIRNLLPGPEEPFRLTGVALSEDTLRRYFVGDLDGIVVVEDNETRQILPPNENGFTDLALSPDGRRLVATGHKSWVVLVPGTSAQFEIRQLYTESPDLGIAVGFTPDSEIIILANSQELQFWSANEGPLLGTVGLYASPQADSMPASLAVSPDGSLIALGSQEGFITLYAVPGNPAE